MRGKARSNFHHQKCNRITPAYAGKSTKPIPKEAERKGSPPPMRGKVSVKLDALATARITPAYAGKRRVDFMEKKDT